MPKTDSCAWFSTPCTERLQSWNFGDYSEPLCQRAQSICEATVTATEWTKKQSAPIVNHATWTWEKTGTYWGAPGQALLVLLVAGISYNLFQRLFGKTEKKNEPAKQEQLRQLVQEEVNRSATRTDELEDV